MKDRDYPYLSAVAIVMVAFLIRLGLNPWLEDRSPFLAFAVAVILAAGRYGFGPGLLATGLSVIIGTGVFVATDDSFRFGIDQVTNVGLFLLASAAMLAFAAHLKASKEGAIQLQAQLQRRQTESAMGAMAATLAHELNQPLAAATNYLAACQRLSADLTGANAAKLTKGLNEAEAQILRAGEIIRQARQIVTSKAAQREEISLRQTVSTLMEPLRAGGACENARVRLEIEAEADKVLANRTQIEQVLMNLLRNACQACEGHAPIEIQVSARVADGFTIATVRDSGPGIAEERIDRLFSAKGISTSGGLGLGLTISRAIVEAHGGRIWAENNPDGGASFFFTIPRTPDGS